VRSVVLDANAVGHLISFVAPGYLARLGYRARYPAPDRPAGEVLMISVVASLPLVALVNAVIPGRQQVTQIEYVVALLVLALTVGYGLAAARGTRPVERLLARVGYRIQAEGSIYAQTLKHMSAEATVVVECTTDDKSGAALAAGHRTRTTASTNSIWSIRAPGLTGSGSRLAKVSSCRSLRSARSLCPRSRLARPFRHDRTTLSPPHRRLRLRRRALRDQRAARGRRLLPLHALSAPHRHGDAGLSQDRAGLVLATAGEEHLRAWSPPGGLDKVFRGEGGPALSGRDPDHHQFVAYTAPWEPISDDGLSRFDERIPG